MQRRAETSCNVQAWCETLRCGPRPLDDDERRTAAKLLVEQQQGARRGHGCQRDGRADGGAGRSRNAGHGAMGLLACVVEDVPARPFPKQRYVGLGLFWKTHAEPENVGRVGEWRLQVEGRYRECYPTLAIQPPTSVSRFRPSLLLHLGSTTTRTRDGSGPLTATYLLLLKDSVSRDQDCHPWLCCHQSFWFRILALAGWHWLWHWRRNDATASTSSKSPSGGEPLDRPTDAACPSPCQFLRYQGAFVLALTEFRRRQERLAYQQTQLKPRKRSRSPEFQAPE